MATLIRGDGRTVNAYQDSIMGDFAFSGKDGIIKNVGQACGLDTTTLNSVKVKSGMVVIQGRQIALDGTDTITLPVPTGSTVYWTTLFLELDMAATTDDGLTGKVTLKKLEYTSSYPAVPTSDNLKVQTAGKAYLGLYRFKNTANGINSVESIAETINGSDIVDDMVDINTDIESIKTNISSINRRLDELGFKMGSTTIPGATLTKQAKYAILSLPGGILRGGTMSFTAKNTVTFYVAARQQSTAVVFPVLVTISGNELSVSQTYLNYIYYPTEIGFEIR